MEMEWTDERVERLKKYRGEGYSASEIGLMLGVTRNAALGKLFRLGLSKPSANARRQWPRERVEALKQHLEKGLSARETAAAMDASYSSVCKIMVRNGLRSAFKSHAPRSIGSRHRWPAAPPPILLPPDHKPVSFVDIGPHQCMYVVGEPAGRQTLYCGADGYPWCQYHYHIVYRPLSKISDIERERRRRQGYRCLAAQTKSLATNNKSAA
jgi:GcrA cell cycle regulator